MSRRAVSVREHTQSSLIMLRSPLAFFLLVAVLSVPFAVLGEATELQLYPGIPVAALAFVCPVTAASMGSAGAPECPRC